ncbi:MAG TPA: ADP-ribosylation factor-like protein [Myxococcota bacterium]|nr:ADP-ribosylation factor-like protein [Myxococcota bacterium]
MTDGASGAGKREVDARIVYWGIAGAGKTTNLRAIHQRLRPDHRGPLRSMPTRLDPTVCYELLPIELGEVQGVKTRLQIVSVPGGEEHALTRKQLLDRVDGVVFVVDAQRDRLDENLAALEELRGFLADYGRGVAEVPIVLQYNKQDLADPFALEDLHRKLDMRGVAAFEAVATGGTGVLQTLTTISKQVVRTRRDPGEAEPAARPAPPRAPAEGVTAPLARARAPEAPAAPLPSAASAVAPAPAVVGAAAAGPALAASERLPLETLREAPGAADQALGRTRGALEGPAGAAAFRETANALHAEALQAAGSGGELAIVATGEARVRSPRSVELPLVLLDPAGQELRLVLTLQLDPDLRAAAAAAARSAPGRTPGE